MPTERDPCPGCGKVVAYRQRGARERWQTARRSHQCPHGRDCIGQRCYRVSWWRGDWRHWRSCPECCEAARAADGAPPSIFDCHRCGTPLALEPEQYQELCPPPPHGAVVAVGVPCQKCPATSSYGFTRTTAHRLEVEASAQEQPTTPLGVCPKIRHTPQQTRV